MKPRSILTISPSTLLPLRGLCRTSLLAVILLTGCAQAAAPTPAQTEAPVTGPPAEPSPLPAATLPSVAATEVAPTEAPPEEPQPVATSRGPDLEATDPATVSLASGELQLVEFFRFT
jgi:hypothetical protein